MRELRAAAGAGRRAASLAVGVARSAAAPLTGRAIDTGPPDRRLALERYHEVAPDYDTRTRSGDPYRRLAVDRLPVGAGDVVLDVGCGTGLNFAAITDAIGPRGRVVGIEMSPDMLVHARERAARLPGVSLVEAPVEEAEVDVRADAALLCGTHDILRSATALRNVLRHVRPGGVVVAGGPKWVPWWLPGAAAMNLWTWQTNRAYVTTFEGFDRPWSRLEPLVADLAVEEVLFHAGFIAVGTRPARLP